MTFLFQNVKTVCTSVHNASDEINSLYAERHLAVLQQRDRLPIKNEASILKTTALQTLKLQQQKPYQQATCDCREVVVEESSIWFAVTAL